MKNRILLFFEMFPSSPEYLTVWKAEEVCTIIGYVDEEGRPNTDSYLRVLRELRQKELLERVEKRTKEGADIYGFRTINLPSLSSTALSALNSKTPPSVTYCNPDERAAFQAAALIDELPTIYLYELGDRTAWWKILPKLIDFTLSETWEFWTTKAPLALKGKGHPLRAIEDPDLRLQTALTGLEKGLNRNRESNPDWKAENHYAYALHSLTRRVGREAPSNPLSEAAVKEIRKEAEAEDDQTLYGLACKTHGLGGACEDEELSSEQAEEPETLAAPVSLISDVADSSQPLAEELAALRAELDELKCENQKLTLDGIAPPPQRRESPRPPTHRPSFREELLDPEYCEEHGLNYEEMLSRFS